MTGEDGTIHAHPTIEAVCGQRPDFAKRKQAVLDLAAKRCRSQTVPPTAATH